MIELYQGNALHVMRLLNRSMYDAVITDPPYASGGMTLSDRQRTTASKYTSRKGQAVLPDFEGDAMDQRTWIGFMADLLEAARRVCKPGAVCVMFADWRQVASLTEAMQRGGWIYRGICVWNKPNSRPQMGRYKQECEFIVWGSSGALPVERGVPCLRGFYQYNNVSGEERVHQTQKPLQLMRELVRLCVPGGAILDPFTGSGTTLEAARLEGYSATGIELSEGIARTAAQRLQLPEIKRGGLLTML